MMYDSRNPAPGVRVAGVPMPRVTGLSVAQAKGRRTLVWAHTVLSPKPLVQPVKTGGGGLPPSMVKPSGDTRSANHRRRSPKMRAFNLSFSGQIPSNATYDTKRLLEKLRELENVYRRIVSGQVNAKLDEKYERLRASFHRLHRNCMGQVISMEQRVEAVCHG